MGYIETVLDRDERVLHRGFIHWIIYAPAILLTGGVALFAVCVALFAVESKGGDVAGGMFVMVFLAVWLALVFWLTAWIERSTTEMAVTSRRVIVKRGLIRRSTIEMNAGQIESVQIDQSIAGRLLDYGTVTVRGTGSGIEPIAKVAAPLVMREAVGRLTSAPAERRRS
jgi:uncharacterized membrane protein YdbT with pleckstrin-like domain